MSSNPTERIEVRKIYAGRAAIFGLFYGFIIGFIMVIFVLFNLIFFEESASLKIAGKEILSTGMIILFLFLFLIGYTILSSIAMGIGALFYNLISSLGGMIHVGLAENEVKQRF